MPRYIDVYKAKNEIRRRKAEADIRGDKFLLGIVEAALDYVESADVAEVKHGEWLENGANYKCSVCGNTESYYTDSYCRCCGAKMDGE